METGVQYIFTKKTRFVFCHFVHETPPLIDTYMNNRWPDINDEPDKMPALHNA